PKLIVRQERHQCAKSIDIAAMLPAWSPNGDTLAFFTDRPLNTRRDYEDAHLWLVSRSGGDQRDLMTHLDRTLAAVQPDYHFSAGATPIWSPDGQTLYFVSAEHGASPHHRYFQWKLTLDWFASHLHPKVSGTSQT
ncbi:MAG: TolB family protein, partial [Ktedonobacteraceae bacterium]